LVLFAIAVADSIRASSAALERRSKPSVRGVSFAGHGSVVWLDILVVDGRRFDGAVVLRHRHARGRASCGWVARGGIGAGAATKTAATQVIAGWDLRERRLPSWDETKSIGDGVFDDWLVDQYVSTADLFTELGTDVVWLTTPCFISPEGFTDGTWDPARRRQMNEYVLPALVSRRPQTVSLTEVDTKM
jgi:hypothetical protein